MGRFSTRIGKPTVNHDGLKMESVSSPKECEICRSTVRLLYYVAGRRFCAEHKAEAIAFQSRINSFKLSLSNAQRDRKDVIYKAAARKGICITPEHRKW